MRSLLIKSSIIVSIILAMGSGLTLASASSEPGMFLYPIKQRTQMITTTFGSDVTSEIPAPSDIPQVNVTSDLDPTDDIQSDVNQEGTNPETPHQDEETANPTPTRAQAVDQITTTTITTTTNVEPDTSSSAGVDMVSSSNPDGWSPSGSDLAPNDNSPEDNQQHTESLDDGQSEDGSSDDEPRDDSPDSDETHGGDDHNKDQDTNED